MIVPEVPEFVINPEVANAAKQLFGLALLGGGLGGATGFAIGVGSRVMGEVFYHLEMNEENMTRALRLTNTAVAAGVAVGSIGTPIVALMFSR